MNSRPQQPLTMQPQPPPADSNNNNRGDPEWKKHIKHKQERLLLLHHSAKCPHEAGTCPVTHLCATMKRLWKHMEGCKDNACPVLHCYSSRAILSHYRKCKDPSCPACRPVRQTVLKSKATSQPPLPPPAVTLPPPPPTVGPGGDGVGGGVGGGGGASRDSSEWQKIRHKQQRLLLLRHASRCQHEAGKCPVTPHCAMMKKLWKHIAQCKNQQCQVQHCLSSRYVLSHYRRCKDTNCPWCGPVRETIRKSIEIEQTRKISQPGMISSTPGGPSLGLDFHQPEPKRPKYDEPPPTTTTTPSQHQQQQKHQLPPHLHSSSSLEMPPFKLPIPLPTSSMQPAIPNVTSSGQSVDFANAEQEQQHHSLARVQPSAAPFSNVTANLKVDDSEDSSAPGDLSLLQSFTVQQLKTHLASLDRKIHQTPAKLKASCLKALKGLQTHENGWVFSYPVDPVQLELPDYFDVIKKPMDLGTIQNKVENGSYHAIKDFQADVYLTFDNAMTYNQDGSVVFNIAMELRAKFEVDQRNLMAQLEAEDLQRRQNERACALCGCEKLLFEPLVYLCNGMNCQNQRIPRNSQYYIGGNNQYFWCSTCYNELDETIPIELVDMTVMKADLKEKKNDEVHEESWVQCDTCERWVHEICGLFNGRQNSQCCPICLCTKLESGMAIPTPRPPGAAELPRTLLSEWLEKHIMKRVEKKKRQLAEEKANTEGISLEEATRLMDGGPIYVRQVTSIDRKLEVRDLMKNRYAHKNYPDDFLFRCKCIVVFQEIAGVDTLLFAMYLNEHGEESPPPNQRVVYISCLDSVHFMRPRNIRTFVYHEILIAYMDYARRRGFATAHIRACPPLNGDGCIFHAKPEDQKAPTGAMLRQWYIDMLVECQKRNIVGKLTNMYDLYFANESLDATAVPYMEGDFFPIEAENIIKTIDEGGEKKMAAVGGKEKMSKSSLKHKDDANIRSSGVDEMSPTVSCCYGGVESFKVIDRDPVMVKLGEAIMPTKDSHIVAFLNWSGAKEEDMVVPPEIEKARIEYAANGEIDDITGRKRDALGNPRDDLSLIVKDGHPIKVIDDDKEDLDCEFLNNRQAFLNLCRANNYQFDELRRSKHSSMMVLWHLHNRDAPKIL